MAERKPERPEAGDLIISTTETVTDSGVYAKLDEYYKRSLLHVSEISSSWIRSIRDFVLEGQKKGLKVLRVDLEKGQEIRCMKSNGEKIIKESFVKAKSEKPKDANITFYVIAAPKCSIEASAENYKRAEGALQKTAQSVVSNVTKAGGQGTFRREK
jgi:translation initiation factor 2 alpha subunit (eIF-2alpha)